MNNGTSHVSTTSVGSVSPTPVQVNANDPIAQIRTLMGKLADERVALVERIGLIDGILNTSAPRAPRPHRTTTNLGKRYNTGGVDRATTFLIGNPGKTASEIAKGADVNTGLASYLVKSGRATKRDGRFYAIVNAAAAAE